MPPSASYSRLMPPGVPEKRRSAHPRALGGPTSCGEPISTIEIARPAWRLGEQLEVVWEIEPGAHVIERAGFCHVFGGAFNVLPEMSSIRASRLSRLPPTTRREYPLYLVVSLVPRGACLQSLGCPRDEPAAYLEIGDCHFAVIPVPLGLVDLGQVSFRCEHLARPIGPLNPGAPGDEAGMCPIDLKAMRPLAHHLVGFVERMQRNRRSRLRRCGFRFAPIAYSLISRSSRPSRTRQTVDPSCSEIAPGTVPCCHRGSGTCRSRTRSQLWNPMSIRLS